MVIELEVFFYTKDQQKLRDLDIEDDVPIEDCELRKFTFCSINDISPYKEKGSEDEYCSVYSNGDNFVCNISYKDMKTILDHEEDKKREH